VESQLFCKIAHLLTNLSSLVKLVITLIGIGTGTNRETRHIELKELHKLGKN